MFGSKKKTTERVLPSFPMVRIGLVGDQISAQWVVSGHQVLGPVATETVSDGKVGEVSGRLAASVAGGYGYRYCRVEATNQAGEVESLGIDVQEKKLVPLTADGGIVLSVEEPASSGVSRKNKLLGFGIMAGCCLLVAVLVFAVLVPAISSRNKPAGSGMVDAGSGSAQVPGPAQLLQRPPAGFSSYARWAGPLGGSSASTVSALTVGQGAVLDSEVLVGVSKDRVEVFAAGTGARLASVETGLSRAVIVKTQLPRSSDVYAVYDGARTVRGFSVDQGTGAVKFSDPLVFPAEVKSVRFGGDRPLGLASDASIPARSGGTVWVFDDNGAAVKRQVPPSAVPVAAFGQSLLAVDTTAGAGYWVSDSEIRSPSPVTLPIPAGQVLVAGEEPGMLDGWLILQVSTSPQLGVGKSSVVAVKTGHKSFSTVTDLAQNSGAGSLARRTVSAKGSIGVHGDVLCLDRPVAFNTVTGAALPVPNPQYPPTSGGCGGGRWWLSTTTGEVAVSADGSVTEGVKGPRTAAAYGSAEVIGITDDGLALVKAPAPDSASASNSTPWVYALEPETGSGVRG